MLDKTDVFLIVASAMLCTVCACCLGWLGWQYDHVGLGLNPLIAYPLATLFFAAPIAWAASITEG